MARPWRSNSLYPNTNPAGDESVCSSWTENNSRLRDRTAMGRNPALHAGVADRRQPGFSPPQAARFEGLPPAFVVTGEADLQRDDREADARRLREGDVTVEHVRYPSIIHGYFQMAVVIGAARYVIGRIGAAAHSALARGTN